MFAFYIQSTKFLPQRLLAHVSNETDESLECQTEYTIYDIINYVHERDILVEVVTTHTKRQPISL